MHGDDERHVDDEVEVPLLDLLVVGRDRQGGERLGVQRDQHQQRRQAHGPSLGEGLCGNEKRPVGDRQQERGRHQCRPDVLLVAAHESKREHRPVAPCVEAPVPEEILLKLLFIMVMERVLREVGVVGFGIGDREGDVADLAVPWVHFQIQWTFEPGHNLIFKF